MDVAKAKNRLSQKAFIDRVDKDIRPTELLTVYLRDRRSDNRISVYCGLIPNAKLSESLQAESWDIRLGEGMPGAVQYHSGTKKEVEYLRFGNDDGYEPLVIYREFHGMRNDYCELSEEFRLFHRLYHDRKQDHFIKIDDSGNEHVVAIIEPDRVQVRLLELRQFLAIKEMNLGIFFDCVADSTAKLSELGVDEGPAMTHNSERMTYTLAYGDYHGMSGHFAFSRLLGKRIVTPLPKAKSGFWGFGEEEVKQHTDFIIGVDESGTPLLHTSDPDRLANYFGANPDAPNYLTAVHFRKNVLDKYYQQSSKYSVETGYLRCGGLWGMQMDNHHQDKVVAWLGDLGRDLPYEEQLHWRSYNIAPAGGVSKVYFKRQILAIATDSDQPEHIFKSEYHRLLSLCDEKLGWRVLLPLAAEDEHYFSSLRVPAGNEQKDFDDLVLALTKILVDSLNEGELIKRIPPAEAKDLKGSISRFEKACMHRGVLGYESHVKFLRDLQSLRSSGSAHRKGSNYRKIAEEFGIDSFSLRSVFQGLLVKGLNYLEFLHGLVASGKLG